MAQTVITKEGKAVRIFTTKSFSLTQESWMSLARPERNKRKSQR